MANSEDTEITLGTGKMLAIFFGLVALCAVFFGMGFSLGKSSAAPNGAGVASAVSSGRHAGQAGGGWIQSDFEEVTCIVGAETSEFKTKADLRSSSSATPAWS